MIRRFGEGARCVVLEKSSYSVQGGTSQAQSGLRGRFATKLKEGEHGGDAGSREDGGGGDTTGAGDVAEVMGKGEPLVAAGRDSKSACIVDEGLPMRAYRIRWWNAKQDCTYAKANVCRDVAASAEIVTMTSRARMTVVNASKAPRDCKAFAKTATKGGYRPFKACDKSPTFMQYVTRMMSAIGQFKKNAHTIPRGTVRAAFSTSSARWMTESTPLVA